MSDTPSNFLLLYEYVDDMAERRGPYRTEHIAQIHAERAAGRLGLAGATGAPARGGALQFIGVDREHIEAFVAADPYTKAGLVRSHRIEPWTLV